MAARPGCTADVTDPSAVQAEVESWTDEAGGVDILVNNAGVPGGGRFVDVSYEDWRRVLDVHVDGAFHVTKAVLAGMTERGWVGSSTSRRSRCGSATRACST